MFGTKINEFDNSLGTIEDFNRIFPNTPLQGNGNVEILDIVEIRQSDVYVRNLDVNGTIIAHDFGSNNFLFSEDFAMSDKIRFKYHAKDFNGRLIAVAYNFKQLANKLNVTVNFVKKRFANPVEPSEEVKTPFNITRKEL